MPRKTPIHEREVAIGERLKEWRNLFHLSRVDFAREAGIDSNYLASVELGRNPLRYKTAYLLWSRWKIFVPWLASGLSARLVAEYSDPILPPPDITLISNALFSKVYDERLKEMFSAKSSALRIGLPTAGAPRSDVVEFLSREIDGWFSEISDSDVDSLLNSLLKCGQDFLRSRTDKRKPVSPLRHEDFKRLRDHLFKIHREKELTRNAEPLQSAGMVNQEGSRIAALKSRIRSVCEPRGKAAQLARVLGVPRQRINDWLSGNVSPTGETALRLLEWVTAEEAKTTALAGARITDKGQETRKKKSSSK